MGDIMAYMHDEVLRLLATSIWTALTVQHVNNTPYCTSLPSCILVLLRRDQNNPGKRWSAIFCSLTLACNLLHTVHLEISFLMTQLAAATHNLFCHFERIWFLPLWPVFLCITYATKTCSSTWYSHRSLHATQFSSPHPRSQVHFATKRPGGTA